MGRRKSNGSDISNSGPFARIEKRILNLEEYIKLSPYAKTLLSDLLAQHNGFNNGDLCITWSLMKERNWRSRATLDEARIDLINSGFIYKTRQGGRNRCSLYALSFYGVTDRKRKFDYPVSEHPRNLFLAINQGQIIREEKPKRKKSKRSQVKKFTDTAAVSIES